MISNTATVQQPHALASLPSRLVKTLTETWCWMTTGHELVRAYEPGRVYGRCLRCLHDSKGFTVDR
jgi:hypothetical protein